MRNFYKACRVMLFALPLALIVSTGFAQTAGTNPNGAALAKSSGVDALTPIAAHTGFISASIDGCGSTSPSCTTDVEKPAGATVLAAYFSAATTGFTGATALDGQLSIDGTPVNWDVVTPGAISNSNGWANVTSIVAPIVNAAAAGTVTLTIGETGNYDGSILIVVFNDPNVATITTVALQFGAQAIAGDTFSLSLGDPFDDATQDITMSLAISYGAQPNGGGQVSLVDVNGQRLTSSAGGEDDGTTANGALITVGGLGDDPANPANPNAGPTNPRSDDELYTLDPFLNSGATSITVDSSNPSNDDNIFFAGFIIKGTAAIIGEGILLGPTNAVNPINTNHTVTASVKDDTGAPKVGVTVDFEIIAGPNTGLTGSDVTDANGEATYMWSSSLTGTDVVVARFVDSQQQTQTSNEARKTWEDDNQPVCVDPSWNGTVVSDGGMLFLPISGGTGGVQVASFYNTSNLLSLGVFDAAFNDITADYVVTGSGGDVTYEYNGAGPAPAVVHLKVAAAGAGGSSFFLIVANECTKIDIDPVLNLNIATESFVLSQNYPNPFRVSTKFTVELQQSATVSVEVYDLLGQRVRTIYSGEMTEGRHELGWDGTSSNGAAVSSGIYLYRVSDGNSSRTMRMSLYK